MNIRALTGKFRMPKIGYGSRIRPMRDWIILVCVSLLLLGGFAVWATWLSMTGDESDGAKAITPPTPVLAPELLQKTDMLFTERALEAERYRSEYQFVDPSLVGS